MVPELDLRMIGHALSSEKMMMTVIESVEKEYFHQDCRLMWSLVSRCFKKYKEIPTRRVLEKAAGAAWNDARVTRKSLSALSAHELDDIGLVPGDIDDIAERTSRF